MKYRIVINGVVQGVGCRALVRGVGRKMHLGGVVRNLDTGEVEAYIEADAEKIIENFIGEIKRAAENTAVDIMKIEVFNEGQNEFYSSRPPKEFGEFRIEHEF